MKIKNKLLLNIELEHIRVVYNFYSSFYAQFSLIGQPKVYISCGPSKVCFCIKYILSKKEDTLSFPVYLTQNKIKTKKECLQH